LLVQVAFQIGACTLIKGFTVCVLDDYMA